ncbi:phage holin family protein [Angustibacter sp. McL0619]|uniref:phage holin family protein n=1 Tax=Angustibacter sp. McL0619 TaxID=3415676 RepID=UPI003CEF318F
MTDSAPTQPSATSNGSAAGLPAEPPSERTLGQLVADASHDLSSILRSEVALAKAEIKADVTAAATGAGMFAGAAVLAFLALILLLISAAFGLVAAGLDPWLAFLIVAAVLLLITLVLVFVGRAKVRQVGPPERTIRTSRETVQALKGAPPPVQ